MKLKATLSIIAAVLLTMIVADVSARTIREEMTVDGIEKPHTLYKGDVIDSVKNTLNMHYYYPLWAFATPDTVIYSNSESVKGLLSEDFDKFYIGNPFTKIAPLRRRTEPYKDENDKLTRIMSECRRQAVNNGVYFVAEPKIWWRKHNYNMETGSFEIALDGDVHMVQNDAEHEASIQSDIANNLAPTMVHLFRCTPFVTEKMHSHFTKKEVWDRIFRRTKMATSDHLIIPISNLDVAVLIEECQGIPIGRSRRPTFDIIYKTRIAHPNEPIASYFELDDIFLVHTPTGQIVWSAKGGDQSQDFRPE